MCRGDTHVAPAHTHERHDIRLATEFDIAAVVVADVEGVPRKRGELYPHRRCSGATWSRAHGGSGDLSLSLSLNTVCTVCIKPRE